MIQFNDTPRTRNGKTFDPIEFTPTQDNVPEPDWPKEYYNLENQESIRSSEGLPNRTFWDLLGGYGDLGPGNFDVAIPSGERWLHSAGAGGEVSLVSHDFLITQLHDANDPESYNFNCAFYCVLCEPST